MLSADVAIARLRDGNLRFASGAPISTDGLTARRLALVEAQEPFAIVLGCSDSRVPPEIVFDQGLGDLFVIRVAGNIVAPSQLGSVEFAADRFGTRLIVVLGHSGCGAVTATLDDLVGTAQGSRDLRPIVDRVRPAVESVVASPSSGGVDTVLERAIRANIRASVDHLRHGSPLLERLIQTDGLMIVGAEYSLQSGLVDFLEDRGTYT